MHEAKRTTASKVIIPVLIAAVLIGLIIFITLFRLEDVSIDPGTHYSEQEIQDLLFTKATDDYAVLFFLRMKYLGQQELPFVEKIDVELVSRNHVSIHVYDKAVTGCVCHMDEYLYFDREGIVVECSDTLLEGIPVVTGDGLSFSSVTLYEPLDVGNDFVFNTILEVILLLDKNGLDAQKLEFSRLYELNLYIDGHCFVLGKTDSYDFKINNIPALLEALYSSQQDLSIHYSFDMRGYDEENMEVAARPLK